MTTTTSASAAATGQRLRGDKRVAILSGALQAFAREGFTRASIDTIANEAGVSTRTIYKHFTDKTSLFATVITESAATVAAQEIALIALHLDAVASRDQVEPALAAFAHAWLSDTGQPDAHRALVRQVDTEADHLSAEAVAAWWQAGPACVRAELAARLHRWAEADLLRVDDAERAAVHFARLVSATPDPPRTLTTERGRKDWITAGVRAFLHGYHA